MNFRCEFNIKIPKRPYRSNNPSGKAFYQSILSKISSSDSGFKKSSVDSDRICDHIFDSVLESIVFASRKLFNTSLECSYSVPQFGHDILSSVMF